MSFPRLNPIPPLFTTVHCSTNVPLDQWNGYFRIQKNAVFAARATKVFHSTPWWPLPGCSRWQPPLHRLIKLMNRRWPHWLIVHGTRALPHSELQQSGVQCAVVINCELNTSCSRQGVAWGAPDALPRYNLLLLTPSLCWSDMSWLILYFLLSFNHPHSEVNNMPFTHAI